MKLLNGLLNRTKIGVISDSIFMTLSFFISYFLRYGHFQEIGAQKQYILFTYLLITWTVLILVFKPYKDSFRKYEIGYLLSKWITFLLAQFALISIFWVAIQEISYSRLRLGYYFLSIFTLGSIYRVSIVSFLRNIRRKGKFSKNFIVIGKGAISEKVIEYYKTKPENGLRFKGFVENEIDAPEIFRNLILSKKIEIIYCSLPYVTNDLINKIREFSEELNLSLKLIMDYDGFFKKGLAIEYHDFIPVVNVSTDPPKDFYNGVFKRAFDIVFSILIMIVGFPLFYLIGVITMLTSRGPIFYKSERIGHWGKKFDIYKFRSMFTNADEIAKKLMNGDMHSQGNSDPRITKWGNFMRRTRIDELPQFYNVLKGDMTLVGPRPLPEYDLEMIKNASPTKYNLLLSMKPGITSIGQIKFGYASDQRENIWRLNYDLIYKDKNSFKLDLWVILQTARVMFQAKGR